MGKLDRVERNRENSKPTRHHIISKCERDLFDVFNPINIVKLRRDTHKSLHTLFTDENGPICEPKNQLRKFVEIVSPVLSDYSLRLLHTLFTMPDKEFYLPGIMKNGYYQ